jgi:cell wall-associated NlpC family hydrolase
MKNLLSISKVILLLLLISGCSQVQRSNTPHNMSSNSYDTQYRAQPRISQRAQSSVVNQNYQPVRNYMVQVATSTIGKPYRWGGDNPQKGFDCSGLMTYVHKNALGINIPRTAAKQRDSSRTIDYAELQPGDMLFFKTGRNSNHVGVYIGDRKFVHAATGSKRVKVASMDNRYWHNRFVKFGTFL